MKKIIYLLAFSLIALFHQSYAQEVKTTDWDNFYKFLGGNIKYPQKARLLDAQGNSVVLLTISNGLLKNFTVINANPELGFDEEVTQKLFTYQGFKESQDGNYALVTAYRIVDAKTPIKNEDYVIPKGYKQLNISIMGYGVNKVGVIDPAKNDPTANPKTFNVVLRGAGSYDAEGKKPLVIINDEVIEYSSMNDIDPNTIKSVSILKDASAISLYGDGAKNGVIIISTKDYVPKKTNK